MEDKKIGILAGLLVVVIVAGAVGYLNLSNEKIEIGKVLSVEMPMEQSIREVEVSIWETSNAIFYYMSKPSKTALEEYKKQLVDVEEFMAKYNVLVNSEEEKQIAAKFEKMWADSVSKAEELIKLRDKLAIVEDQAWDSIHETDNVINYKIKPALLEDFPDFVKKIKATDRAGASLWQALNSTIYYIHNQSDKAKKHFSSQLEDADEFFETYKNLNITAAEKPHLKEFERLWNRSVELMKECVALAEELEQKELAYWESAHAADDVVDFEIQENLKKRIKKRTKL